MEEHRANEAFWDAATPWWQAREDARGNWQRAHGEPSTVLAPCELTALGNPTGRAACVLGSGDNEAAFALAGLGAEVTSVDISQRRLDVAAERARELGLEQAFVRADVTDLHELDEAAFDVVYTGGHMAVWVADITRYYAEAARILRNDGLFLVNEYHPVRRMWADAEEPRPRHRYLHRGPYHYRSDDGLPTTEYHWTVSDHIQAVVDAGCQLVTVEEYGEHVDDEFWLAADLDGLPTNLMIAARKPA
jgi:ubiquinone/menaquinone biosynthesis C-methylase UbiE